MESWRDGFHRAVKEYLETRSYRPVEDIEEILSVTGNEPSEHYCRTCGPDSQTVEIVYRDKEGNLKQDFEYIYIGDFINSLGD